MAEDAHWMMRVELAELKEYLGYLIELFSKIRAMNFAKEKLTCHYFQKG